MSLIAERLGGSKGTLYNYFASKEELFLAVAREKGEELYRKFHDLPEPEGDFAKTLATLGCQMIGIVMSDDYLALYRLIIAEATRVPVIGKMAYESRRSTLLAPLQDHIQAALKKGRLRLADPVEAAEIFWDLCSAAINRRALLAIEPAIDQAEMQKVADRAVAIFLAIYGPRRSGRGIIGRVK